MSHLVKNLEKIGATANYCFDGAQAKILLADGLTAELLDEIRAGGSVHALEVALNMRSNLVCGLHAAVVPDDEQDKSAERQVLSQAA